MGFLDSIRDRFRGEADDDYYEDDYYDGYEGDQGYDEPAPATRRESRTSTPGSAPRLLGNTPRPEAESVSVWVTVVPLQYCVNSGSMESPRVR